MQKKTKHDGDGSTTRHESRTSKKGGLFSKSRGRSQKNDSSDNEKGNMLETFFIDSLKDLYWAEKYLVKGLERMSEEATSDELRQAFEDHKAETEDHVSRLEEVFEMFGQKVQAKKCDAIEGIVKEIDVIIDETEADTYTRDAALIIGAQKAEHYEIATYGGMINLARLLGQDEAADLLEE